MEIKSKSLDGINEITDDTKTGITTTTLEHTINFEKYKKMYGGESEIFKILIEELKKGTFSDCDEEFQYCCYQIISNLQQENKQLKDNWNMLKEHLTNRYNNGTESISYRQVFIEIREAMQVLEIQQELEQSRQELEQGSDK